MPKINEELFSKWYKFKEKPINWGGGMLEASVNF